MSTGVFSRWQLSGFDGVTEFNLHEEPLYPPISQCISFEVIDVMQYHRLVTRCMMLDEQSKVSGSALMLLCNVVFRQIGQSTSDPSS